ncbi:hypothetical protein N6L24_05865 [Cognatishimia sp. SS12]|uniref:hypothetical protein n=1 Tax=Cognatishimia sp. SS12 TaxID=2979465 RepID=UPI00232C9897|nr:hypothetical protein [Cognatishimia sp. SS12]MDC0737796.1 hypothetical protein [Cognatishimia sp. SS12]
MSLSAFLLVFVSVSLSAVGQVAFKLGVSDQEPTDSDGVINTLLAFAASPFIWGGIVAYGLGTIFWLFALQRLDLSLAYPFVAISFIVVFAVGIFGLGEPWNSTRALGLIIISIGLVVMARA